MTILIALTAVSLVLGLSGVAHSDTLFTPALRADQQNDLIACDIVNVSQRTHTARIILRDKGGDALFDSGEFPLAPGATNGLASVIPGAGGESTTYGICQFILSGGGRDVRATGSVVTQSAGVPRTSVVLRAD